MRLTTSIGMIVFFFGGALRGQELVGAPVEEALAQGKVREWFTLNAIEENDTLTAEDRETLIKAYTTARDLLLKYVEQEFGISRLERMRRQYERVSRKLELRRLKHRLQWRDKGYHRKRVPIELIQGVDDPALTTETDETGGRMRDSIAVNDLFAIVEKTVIEEQRRRREILDKYGWNSEINLGLDPVSGSVSELLASTISLQWQLNKLQLGGNGKEVRKAVRQWRTTNHQWLRRVQGYALKETRIQMEEAAKAPQPDPTLSDLEKSLEDRQSEFDAAFEALAPFEDGAELPRDLRRKRERIQELREQVERQQLISTIETLENQRD